MTSTNPLQTEQVRNKVLYSEVDVQHNGYLEALGKVTKLAKSILNSGLQSYEAQENVQFGIEHVKDLEQNASLKFMEYQSSLDVKKLAQENWEQSNHETIDIMETNMSSMISDLRSAHESLQERIERVRVLYDSVTKVNTEAENLLEGNTSLTATLSEWEEELGAPLTDKLIKKGYLREAGTSGGEQRYRAYDNFTKGPKELKHMNQSIKEDISRLTNELGSYKEKWLQDAEIFTRITSVLKEELIKRDMNVDIDMEEEEEEEEEDDEDDEEEEEHEQEHEQEEEIEEEEDENDDEEQEEDYDENLHDDEPVEEGINENEPAREAISDNEPVVGEGMTEDAGVINDIENR